MKDKAFNNQLLEYQKILKNLAKRFTKDQEAINDLVQETFIRALKYMDQFFNNPRVVSWLFVIMRNIYINQYKRLSYQQNYDDISLYYYNQNTSTEPYSEDISDKRMMLGDISKILSDMPSTHGEMFNNYIDGYKYRELSEMYGIPEGTIKSRIHIIRKTLQKRLNMKYSA
ncbi:RNA polymerase sigma-70 factor (ECF subfamily) [Sphingobacterium alimentarium]|uniref:RNA polymerase sigma-70 factor (ECF subfamily) n=1 Tax=Sphingobacterium alimentarium TaxID=797292 RepID=A0A4R3VUK9_9SPHI|nr:RNA polymerase sigma factor [Sphingobacterium alimentarium]TCV10184.1 RNA polymerase sigma-70 factor (ECF subfamily) [Sphingobacterium alimentarium]